MMMIIKIADAVTRLAVIALLPVGAIYMVSSGIPFVIRTLFGGA